MSASLVRTPLFQWHVDHHVRIVDFAGWAMPVQYSSIVDEHHATRRAVGVFDISHMGRLRFEGDGAAELLDRLLTRRVVGLAPGLVRYSLMTNSEGGILDDVLVYHLVETDGTPFHLLVVNAGNREKIVSWIQAHLTASDGVTFRDQTRDTVMIAVQGPHSLEALQPIVDVPLEAMRYYTGQVARIDGVPGLVSRTGYTGEDGCELIVPAESAIQVVSRLFQAGTSLGIQPVGLGARDTLRLEAAMPLYGHELNEDIDPFQAGLGFAVHLNEREFIGAEALRKLKQRPDHQRRIGLSLEGKRVAREHYQVLADETPVGEITSGTFSPTLEQPIAMAYVQPQAAQVGTRLTVDIRGRAAPARVVPLPFYQRSKA